MGKDYLGEFDVALEDVFENGQIVQEVGYPISLHDRFTNTFLAQMVHPEVKAQNRKEKGVHDFGRGPDAVLPV